MKIIIIFLLIAVVQSQLTSQTSRLLEDDINSKDKKIISFPNFTCTSIIQLDLPDQKDDLTYGLTCITNDTFQYYYIEAQLSVKNELVMTKQLALSASLTSQMCNDILQLDGKFLILGCMNRYFQGFDSYSVVTINRVALTKDSDSFYYGPDVNDAFRGRIRLRKFQDYVLIFNEIDTRLEQNYAKDDTSKKHTLLVYKFPLLTSENKPDDYFFKLSYLCPSDNVAYTVDHNYCLKLDFSKQYKSEDLGTKDVYIRSLTTYRNEILLQISKDCNKDNTCLIEKNDQYCIAEDLKTIEDNTKLYPFSTGSVNVSRVITMTCDYISGLDKDYLSHPENYRIVMTDSSQKTEPSSRFLYLLTPKEYFKYNYTPFTKKIKFTKDSVSIEHKDRKNAEKYTISQINYFNNQGGVSAMLFKNDDFELAESDFDNSYYPLFAKVQKGLAIVPTYNAISTGSQDGMVQISLLKESTPLNGKLQRNGVLILLGESTFNIQTAGTYTIIIISVSCLGGMVLLYFQILGIYCCIKKGKKDDNPLQFKDNSINFRSTIGPNDLNSPPEQSYYEGSMRENLIGQKTKKSDGLNQDESKNISTGNNTLNLTCDVPPPPTKRSSFEIQIDN